MKNCSENEVATELSKLIGANNKDHEKVFERESRILWKGKYYALLILKTTNKQTPQILKRKAKSNFSKSKWNFDQKNKSLNNTWRAP